jgi:TonB family protein
VRKRSGQLRDCYQRALKRDASAGGKATFTFTIGPCGQVTGVAVAARRGKVDDAAACAVRALETWRTPFRPSEPVTVEYPIAFSASM